MGDSQAVAEALWDGLQSRPGPKTASRRAGTAGGLMGLLLAVDQLLVEWGMVAGCQVLLGPGWGRRDVVRHGASGTSHRPPSTGSGQAQDRLTMNGWDAGGGTGTGAGGVGQWALGRGCEAYSVSEHYLGSDGNEAAGWWQVTGLPGFVGHRGAKGLTGAWNAVEEAGVIGGKSGQGSGGVRRSAGQAVAQVSERTLACSRTSLVAFSRLSGG